MKIRKAKYSDVEQVLTLGLEWLSKNPKEKRGILEKTILDPNHLIFVAETSGKIVGYIDCWIRDDWLTARKELRIRHLYVTRKYRKLGIGSMLVNEALKHCEYVEVQTVVPIFYVKLHFEHIPRHFFLERKGLLSSKVNSNRD